MTTPNKLRIFEINTRVFCDRFDSISDGQLSRIAELGFNTIWPMGVWRIGDGAKKISKTMSLDYEGSPYAIADYELSPELGGLQAYKTFRTRAQAAGLKVLLDFIPNHMALDSDWIAPNSEFFVRSDPSVRKQDPSEFFLHPSGEVIAHGRDPYFPPWYDTAQLDYSSAALRQWQIKNLRLIAALADGVRCDMAMMILKDHIRRQWYAGMGEDSFTERMPGEFWDEAISAIKNGVPDFVFLAEAYWGKEPDLRRLGFDLTYEKDLYDALVARSVSRIYDRLRQPINDLRSALFFIENHDEARAASVFNPSENIAAMALLLALPGSVLIYQGQMQGFKEKLPIQLRRPASTESPDSGLEKAYAALLSATADPVFDTGDIVLFGAQASDIVSFVRFDAHRIVAYFGQIGADPRQFAAKVMDIGPLWQIARATNGLRLTNLIGIGSILVTRDHGTVRFAPAALGAGPDTSFCLVRVEPV